MASPNAPYKTPVAVLISGSGSNLQALIDAALAEDYPAQIKLVVSNKADAYGLKRAENAGIETIILSHKDYENRAAFDDAVHAELVKCGIEFVCLAGYMRLLSAEFVRKWQNKMLNIHPSLLPAFKGLDAMGQALAAGVKETGCTVHWVTERMDEGPVVLQKAVPILDGDDEETLAPRLHAAEHEIYPKALRMVLSR